MKLLIILAALILATQAFSEDVICRSQKAIQENEPNGMKVDAEISFTVNKETKELTNVIGHIFVQQVFIENEEIGVNNSYLGFFAFDKLSSNLNYKPARYKGYTQFKEFDAIHTAGLESGMWGAFVIDLTKTTQTFDGRYIFKAGDHMGGTVLFTCNNL
ncbi:hypothetical protein SHI21_13735 [Bacteriovorax sp. PP10]|uniref:DUF4352 domain-containing protein n=1 Tax=Bacteriovorax antarcticus TaxID=3088717 RepID=A0ABU5VW32_9BACT|nr:hypothetical protein [Bacteriovorax sp. PP10]MEA9357281.1 hypothetical protein [Bacteriovorax sp. PP10]